ncbi:hypothetical protein ILUMI_26219 [Ignelater luminosus]|uniref:SCP domain-containing protein n=1 Tax=Ignelater luminosus TaxID=2038154 RepID=A0A8K0C3Z0_IGNLU|nr:hypothetical protein ILUMI_26219 [Ignelater luminosus]
MLECLIILTAYIFLANSASEIGPDVNYCNFPCGPHMHTICKLKHRCEVSAKCKRFKNLPFSDNEKQEIIQTHNSFRNLIALGKGCKSIEGKWFPPAASMRELVWDRELEFQAQCWANQCIMERDTCRRKYDGQYAEQILAWIRRESVIPTLRAFFDECKNTSLTNIDSYGTGKEWGSNFAQMVYWNTTQIGCARVVYEFAYRSSKMVMFVCNYAWAGNWVSQPVYIKGSPASQCPAHSKPHIEFKGLCTTDPSKSKVPYICKFANDKKKCIPYLSIDKGVKFRRGQYIYGKRGPVVNYCDAKYNCSNRIAHFVCRVNRKCGVKKRCKKGAQLSQKEKRDILNKHNELRNEVALGQLDSTGIMLPQASDMREIVWDEELEFLAQCWANQCTSEHANCNKKADGTPVGQNMGPNLYNKMLDVVDTWFQEKSKLPNLGVLKQFYFHPSFAHFTQAIHAKTTQIGCAKTKMENYPKFGDIGRLVCNYAPAGNLFDKSVYTFGTPCTKCQGNCHEIYTGLCKTRPSMSKVPNICTPYECSEILEEPGLKQYHHHGHHNWWKHNNKYFPIKKSKKDEKQKFVKSSAALKKNSGFVGFIAVTYNFLLDIFVYQTLIL